MQIHPLRRVYLEQSAITEIITHTPSSPAPDNQMRTPNGVLPTQAPSFVARFLDYARVRRLGNAARASSSRAGMTADNS